MWAFRTTGRISAWVSFVVAAAVLVPLQAEPAVALTEAPLPGGTTISVDISEPGDGATAAGDVPLRGEASIGGGESGGITLVYTLDVSGSTLFSGGCGGDQNGDGRVDTIMDCEAAAVKALNLAAIEAGTVAETGVVVFERNGASSDNGPQSGVQVLTTPDADVNANGVYDIDEVVQSMYWRSLFVLSRAGTRVFSTREVGGVFGGTNFSAGAAASCNAVAAGSQPTNVVAFISDGEANVGGPVADVLPCATPTTFITFAVGANSSCDANPTGRGSLQDIADLTGGTCFEVPDASDLPDILPEVIRTQITSVELTIDGGPPQDISADVSPMLPAPGPVTVSFDHLVEGLSPATHELCVTVHGEDPGGAGSVTECVTVINNRPPTADAGPDQTVAEGTVVGLDGSGSSDPDGDALSYRWQQVGADGPPVFLSSVTSATPSFLAPDDGVYTFELTVTDAGGLTDRDRVTITVGNADPALTIEPGAAFAGGVTLVNASFTDPGWLDTHSATIDWGDGTVDEVGVAAQGTGWGTFFGSHVFVAAGTYAVTVTLIDDDGGAAVASVAELTVADPVAVWANSQTAPKTLDWSGASGSIEGRVHSNNELRFVGQAKTVLGPATYAGRLSADTDRHIFDPAPAPAPVQDYPIRFDVADYRPGGPVATAVGDAYFDMSAACVNGKWHETQVVLDPGVYYADCDIQVNGSNVGGRITLAAEGSIQVSGSRPAFEPFYDGLLFLAGGAGDKAIDLAASDSKFLGVLFSELGEIDVSGSANRFYCGILGDRVDLSGGDLQMRGANCGRPDSTVSGPLLIPDLELALTGAPDDVLPADSIDYQIDIANDGALLVVPGLVGLENVDVAPANVTGFEFSIDYFSIADGAWVTLASPGVGLVLDTRANPAAGVTYPDDGGPVGTTIDPDGLATWGFQGLVTLTPEQVTMLLDPAVAGGVRNRVEFTLDPAAVQVRRLFTFGSDFVDQLGALSGAVEQVAVTLLLPDGESVAFDPSNTPELQSLAPGASPQLVTSFGVPVPDQPGESETVAAYVNRLRALDAADLVATAFATASGGVGFLVAPQQVKFSDRHLPAVDLATWVPGSATAGETITLTADLANRGSASAEGLALTATMDGVPVMLSPDVAALAPGALHSATATYEVPLDALAHVLDSVVTVDWSDTNGNLYGPLEAPRATSIAPAPELRATLADSLIDGDGNGIPTEGDLLHYVLTITNPRTTPVTNVAAAVTIDANLTLVPGSETTSLGSVTSVPGTSPLTVDVGAVPGGATITIEFDAAIPSPFPPDVQFVEVQGTVTGDGIDPISTGDPAGSGIDDPTRTQIVPLTASLAALLVDTLVVDLNGDGVPGAGDTLRYEATIVSQGSAALTGLSFELVPDPNSALVVGSVVTTGQVTTGNGPGDTSVLVDIGDLAPLGTVSVVADVTIVDPLPAGVEFVAAQGSVNSNELGIILTDDPTTGDSRDATVTVLGGIVTPSLPAPAASAVLPADGAIVTEPTSISATLTPPEGEDLVGWSVGYRAAGSMVVTELAAGTGPAVNAEIDPTVLPNGTYLIVITAESTNGGISVTESSIVIDGRLKLGRYVTTFQDMAVGVAGFPVQVLRTYDSFDKTVGDFGIGWTLEIADFRVSTNGPLGAGGWLQEQCGGGLIFVPLCYTSERPHFVTVTWPDGLTEIFDLTPAQGSTFFPGLTQAEFTGRPNTTSSLEAVDDSLFWSNGDLLGGGFGTGGVFDPQQYRLTDRFGTEYLLDVDLGLLEMRDRVGNTVTITPDGITSSYGPGIDITRDTLGRIELITAPDGSTVGYQYDANGDLQYVTDQNGNRTTLTYYPGHFLNEILDPTDQPLRTLVYEDGRIVAVIDGEGNPISIQSDVGNRQEVVTDAEGRLTTISHFDERGNLVQLDEILDGQPPLTTSFGYDENDNIDYRKDPLDNEWSATYEGRDLVSFQDPAADDISIEYDEFGFPRFWTDQENNVTEYVWNPDGTLAEIVDPYGFAETYTYYPDGNRHTRTDRESNTWTWTYYPDGLVETEQDPNGNVTRFFYDDAGRLVRTLDALGGETIRAYDGVGNLRFLTDPEGNVTESRYDVLNRLERRIDPELNETAWTYYDNGLVHTVTNGAGETTTYTYDRNGRTRTAQVAGLTPTTYVYDAAGRVELVTDPAGRETSYSYYANGWLQAETSPFGGTTEYFYFDDGQLQRVEDPFDHTTSYTYTPRGQIDTVTDPMLRVTDYDYDKVGRQTIVRFPDLTYTESEYDRAGRLEKSIDQDRRETVFGYDGVGNRTSVTDAAGRTITYGFDALNRLETISNDLGETTISRYDRAGRLRETESPTGVVMAYDYWANGLRKTETDEYGNTWSWTYDGAGRVDVATDARGATTDHDYDPAGRLASITDHFGNTVAFGYNDAGERISLTDPRLKTWTFDPGPVVRTESDPLGNTETWAYDVGGRLDSYTDGRGVTQSYAYWPDGQLRTVTRPGGQVDYTYDPLGRRQTMTDESGTTTWGYDPVGRVTSVSAPAGDVSYTYWADGQRKTMTQPEGTVSYVYDDVGRLEMITDWNSDPVGFSYNPDGRLATVSRPNGISTNYTYDLAGRLARIDHTDGGGVVEFFDYSLDANGNRVGVTSTAGAETYTLNLLNQLTGLTYPDGGAASFTYDPAGNRQTMTTGGVTTTYVYDDASRLASDGTVTYSYDGAGNLTWDGTSTYGWDWDGRLKSVTTGPDVVSYTYDADGVRVASGDGASTTGYVYDRVAGLPTLVSDGSEAFVHGPDGLLASYAPTGTSWALTDALGSVRATTDPAGAVTGSSSYDVFGDVRSATGEQTSFGFTGAQQDPSGLVYLNARYLSPDIGAFLSVDPVRPGAPGVAGYNPYSYVGNNPTTWTDPSGATTYVEYAETLGPILVAGAAAALLAMVLSQMILECLRGGFCVPTLPAPTFPGGGGGTGSGAGTGAAGAAGAIGALTLEELIELYREKIPELTRAAARAAAKACVAANLIDFFPGVESPCGGGDVRIYFSGGFDQPVQTRHIKEAQKKRPDWVKLTRKIPPHDRSWLDNQPVCIQARSEGKACDEYPFASTREGGFRNVPSLKGAPRDESDRQGATLGGFYSSKSCAPFPEGTPFAVVAVTSKLVPTFRICK